MKYYFVRNLYMKKKKSFVYLLICLFVYLFILAAPQQAGPSSTNFELKQYSFGSGGTDTNTTSTNFKLFGTAGEVEFGRPTSTNFKAGSGLTYLLNVNVPLAPTFTNPATNYDRLQFVINQGGNH